MQISAAPDGAVQTAPVAKICDRPTKAPPQQAVPANTQAPDTQEGPPSPLSEASSGYFSHSVSTATLSDALIPGLDAAAQAGGQTPGSPPPALCQDSPEAELPLPPATASTDSLSAQLEAQSSLQSLPGPAKQNARGGSSGASEAKEAGSWEKPNKEASASPTCLPTSAPQNESPSQQSGEVSSATQQPGRPQDQAKPATGLELDVCKPQLPSDLLPQAPAPASPFRIRKVRTSELKSFTRMLGGEPGCPSGAEEDPLVPGGPGSGSSGGQALGKPEVSSDSEEASEVPEWLKEGEYVTVGTNKTGIVRYIGPTDFQEGTWVGVELDLPSGECGLWRRLGVAAEVCWSCGWPRAAQRCALGHTV